MTQTPERLTEAELDEAERYLSEGYNFVKWARTYGRRLIAQARQSSVSDDGWNFDMDAAPMPKWGEPRAPVVLAWTNRDGPVCVGEAYWYENEDREHGAWWWANTSWGDYCADQISESITGRIIAYRPLPAPPSSQDKEPG